MDVKNTFEQTFKWKLIYIFAIPDKAHEGSLKIGETSLDSDLTADKLPPNCKALNEAAKKRIDQCTKTAGIFYNLLHTELAFGQEKDISTKIKFFSFGDHEVHRVLENSGIEKVKIGENCGDEWYKVDLETAKNAISAVKNGRTALFGKEKSGKTHTPIVFRPEQKEAIAQTCKHFKKHDRMLWNAKMRFGKTLTALEVAKRCGFQKTIIATHRPVVKEGWFEDFDKIFFDTDWKFGSKGRGESFENLLKGENPFVYFASLQDLRGSEIAGGKFDKNAEIFECDWDFVIIDEAHEGTQTELGQNVRLLLVGKNTKTLELSGTPFNLLEGFDEGEVFTWDYVMEQQAKADWLESHFGDENPYSELPKLNIYTYDLGENFARFCEGDERAFNFHEFFRTWTGDANRDGRSHPMPQSAEIGDFVHEDAVKSFLNLLCGVTSRHADTQNRRDDMQSRHAERQSRHSDANFSRHSEHSEESYDARYFAPLNTTKSTPDNAVILSETQCSEKSHYPFSTQAFRENFKHTLWAVPGVKEAKALSVLLKKHPVFSAFAIVNVAGEGDEEEPFDDALKKVQTAIRTNEYTITLTCGRLTLGVTVPEWSAVLMLSGSYSTSAANYMQTIFRVQSPGQIEGRQKTNCYAFDFAPDRTLKIVAEAVKVGAGKRDTTENDRALLGEFLNFCPVIAISGSKMKPYDVPKLLQHLKRYYADKAWREGFDSACLYNGDKLLQLTEGEIALFRNLHNIVGRTAQQKKSNEISINAQGLTEAEFERLEQGGIPEKVFQPAPSPEMQALLDKEKQAKDLRRKCIENLRAISIRIPLVIYGADFDDDDKIEISALPDILDANSWAEFMPRGVTKDIFKQFVQYYDEDVFAAACKKIREQTRECDKLPPTKRVQKIAEIFSHFKNPDKETVLTPWRVVNLHLSETLGGWNFGLGQRAEGEKAAPCHSELVSESDEKQTPKQVRGDIRFVSQGDITAATLANPNAKILEINSKTGLYPLYCAYSLWKARIGQRAEGREQRDGTFRHSERSEESLWRDVLSENIFVICKTPMAKAITRRTLAGFTGAKINAHCFDDLLMQLKEKRKSFCDKVLSGNLTGWKKGEGKMHFDAVVGNPPYQGENHSQVYPFFYLAARELGDVVSLVFPTGWQQPKNANNLSALNNEEIKSDRQIVFIDNRQNLFPDVSGVEWVNFVLWQKGFDNGLSGGQKILTNGENPQVKKLIWEQSDIEKPAEILQLAKIVQDFGNFKSMQDITSVTKPYGIRKNDALENPEKYGLPPFNLKKQNDEDIKIYGSFGKIRWMPKDYPLPRKTIAFDKFKVLVGSAWGAMNESVGLGGAYADIIISKPFEACTETYQESGCFDDFETAKKHAKYLMTKFCRALLYVNKLSQMSSNSWGAIPVQDYSENWWEKSIAEIDIELMKKYSVPQNVADFVFKNIQTKTEANIVNF